MKILALNRLKKKKLFIKIGIKINQKALHLVDINYNSEEFLLSYYSRYVKKLELNYNIPILELITKIKIVINFKTILFRNHFI
jgi:hypothetical protein